MFSPSIVSKIDKFSTTEEIVTKLQSESESESDEDRLFTATKSLPEEAVSRRSTIFPKKTTIQEKIDCEEDPSDPACLMQKYDTSSEELFIKELTTTETAETSLISDKEVTSKEEIFQPSIEEKSEEITQSVSTSKEEEVVSEVIGETTPFAFAKDIFTKSSEAYASQSTDQASVDASSLETKITTSHSAEYVEEYSKPEEDKDSNVLTSEELEKVDYISSSSESIVTSSEVGIEPGVTTEKSSVEFIEFTKKPSKPDQIFDKLSESPISTKSVTGTIMIESSSMSEEVTSKETKERAVGEETTMIGLKTSEEREFISTIPTKVRSTTLSPVRSGEVSYSCENSEDCASSEGCDEFGNCEKRLPKFDTIRPPKLIKVPLSEESRITEHTTVTNVATTMLISQESDGRSTAKHITTDTRRSTTTSTPQHKLSLKVKILLEHINENKEKHNLVEVEKHLSLDENPEHHLNPDLLEQLKSLNDSVNMETINALLNCTSLGNLTKNSNFVDKEPNNVDSSDAELEFKNTDFEDLSSEQFISRSDDAKVDYSEYQEHVTSRRRKRRSFDNEMEDLNKFVQQKLYDSSDSVVDTFNNSQTQHNESTNTTYGLQLSTTTNYSQEETTTNNYTESERNITKQEDQSTMSSTIITISDVDLSNTSESRDANVTKEDVQLTTTYKPEEETNITMYIESETNITNGINESIVPSTRNNMSNETKMEVVRETIPGIQEDVVAGLQHMVSQLSQSNLTLINNVKEAVKTNLLGILADPSDSRVRLRRRRAATEKVGHWSNERIKEAPMGGNLRSFTEFTLYKVPS